MSYNSENLDSLKIVFLNDNVCRIMIEPGLNMYITRTGHEEILVFFREDSFNIPYFNSGAEAIKYAADRNLMYARIPLFTGRSPVLNGMYGLFSYVIFRFSQHTDPPHMFDNFNIEIFSTITKVGYKWVQRDVSVLGMYIDE